VPPNTLAWAHLTRYADYRALYPWIERNYSQSTLDRIDLAWDRVPMEKKSRPREDVILEIVRQH